MRITLFVKFFFILIVFLLIVGAALFFVVRRSVSNGLIFEIKYIQSKHILNHILEETELKDWFDPSSSETQAKFQKLLIDFFAIPDLLRIKIWSPEGSEVIFTDEGARGLIGKRFPENEEVAEALEKGKVIFERGEAEEFVRKPEHVYDLELGDIFEIYVPVIFPGQEKPVGVVEIYQSTAIFTQVFSDFVRFFILILAAAMAVLFFLVFIIFQYFITRPLAFLTKASREIAAGNLAFEVKALAKDEFGDLTEKFDFMRRALKKKIESEEEQRQKLELINIDLENSRKSLLNTLEDLEAEQKQVKRERSKLETILVNINDAVILTDLEGSIVAVNKMFEKIFGIPAKDILGRPFDVFADLMRESFSLTNRNGSSANHLYSKNGKNNQNAEKWFRKAFSSYAILEKELTLSHSLIEYGIVAGPEKPIFKLFTTPAWSITMTMMGRIWVFSDVSSQKELERARTEFISLTSHQLRTPSSGIKAFLELILGGDAGPLTETQKDYLNEVYRSNERMIELIEALLNVSKIESGRLTLEPRPVDLIKLSEEVIEEVMPLIGERKQKFEFIKPAGLPQTAVDGKLVYQVISNLLTNASKYNSEGGSIILKISKEANEILFEISDTGWGIPERQHDKVFTKFFRGDNAVLKGTVGSGLGLYIVKQIVEKSGGRVWFESEEDKGTTFYFTLPVASPNSKP